jgi:hypothetical protein
LTKLRKFLNRNRSFQYFSVSSLIFCEKVREEDSDNVLKMMILSTSPVIAISCFVSESEDGFWSLRICTGQESYLRDHREYPSLALQRKNGLNGFPAKTFIHQNV